MRGGGAREATPREWLVGLVSPNSRFPSIPRAPHSAAPLDTSAPLQPIVYALDTDRLRTRNSSRRQDHLSPLTPRIGRRWNTRYDSICRPRRAPTPAGQPRGRGGDNPEEPLRHDIPPLTRNIMEDCPREPKTVTPQESERSPCADGASPRLC
ncbi:hypothetical protein VUR80DRAFT_2315 [Thermomyces stellatus]